MLFSSEGSIAHDPRGDIKRLGSLDNNILVGDAMESHKVSAINLVKMCNRPGRAMEAEDRH